MNLFKCRSVLSNSLFPKYFSTFIPRNDMLLNLNTVLIPREENEKIDSIELKGRNSKAPKRVFDILI